MPLRHPHSFVLTALALLLPVSAAVAAEANGMMVVSVTIVASCDVSAVGQSAVTVSCPQDHPYRLSLTPASEGQGLVVPAADGRSFTGSRELSLATPGVQGITRLTISY